MNTSADAGAVGDAGADVQPADQTDEDDAVNTNAVAPGGALGLQSAATTEPAWLSIPKAARHAGVHRRTIDAWIKRGKIEVAYLPSGVARVRLSSLLAAVPDPTTPTRRRAERARLRVRAAGGVFVPYGPGENGRSNVQNAQHAVAAEHAVAATIAIAAEPPAQLSTPAAPGSGAMNAAAVGVRRVPIGRRIG